MPKAFSWLPFTDNCCGCILNLQIAVYIIAAIGIIQFLTAILEVAMPHCSNLHASQGSFRTLYLISQVVFSMAATCLFATSLVMVFSTIFNNPILKPFIISIFVFCVVLLIETIIFIVRMSSLKGICEHKNKMSYRIHPFHHSMKITVDVLTGMIMFYFAIVVNSYAILWDRYGGNIPAPEEPTLPVNIRYRYSSQPQPPPPGNQPPQYQPPPENPQVRDGPPQGPPQTNAPR